MGATKNTQADNIDVLLYRCLDDRLSFLAESSVDNLTAGAAGQAIFASLNRDKQSVGLDLGDEPDRESLLKLVERADVVVENFSHGAMERHNLGYERLAEVNDDLIYVRITGFDEAGPYGDRGATDPMVQAMSGLMSVTGHADGSPVRAGTSVVDITTAQNAVVAVLLALQERRESGEGTAVTVPLFRTGVALMSYWLSYYQQFGENPEWMGAAHALFVPYNVYPTADGNLFVGATSERHWRAIKDELGLDVDYDDGDSRLANRGTIDRLVADATADRKRAEVAEALLAKGVPVGPINELEKLSTTNTCRPSTA
jgi:formyl-CoA transferase